jgi:hypothetical protein
MGRTTSSRRHQFPSSSAIQSLGAEDRNSVVLESLGAIRVQVTIVPHTIVIDGIQHPRPVQPEETIHAESADLSHESFSHLQVAARNLARSTSLYSGWKLLVQPVTAELIRPARAGGRPRAREGRQPGPPACWQVAPSLADRRQVRQRHLRSGQQRRDPRPARRPATISPDGHPVTPLATHPSSIRG